MSAVAKQRPARLARASYRGMTRPSGSAMLSAQAWEEIARSLKLSRRELQIVQGAFDDETELAIAHALGISAHTVHTHVERLHRKLTVSNRSQLLIRIIREFLALTLSLDNNLPPICGLRRVGYCPGQTT